MQRVLREVRRVELWNPAFAYGARFKLAIPGYETAPFTLESNYLEEQIWGRGAHLLGPNRGPNKLRREYHSIIAMLKDPGQLAKYMAKIDIRVDPFRLTPRVEWVGVHTAAIGAPREGRSPLLVYRPFHHFS